jgi:hypothetical protein
MVLSDRPLPIADNDSVERAMRDIDAECAVARGLAETLTTYFRDFANPLPSVLQSLVRCLIEVGPSNQTLRFHVRNGRPPKKQEQRPSVINEAAAIAAFDRGDEKTLALYLHSEQISDQVRQILAESLSADGKTRRKLVFRRIRCGYPDTPLRTELKKAVLGHTAQDLKDRGMTWKKVLCKLNDEGLIGDDEAGLKDAVCFVRNRTKKPPR